MSPFLREAKNVSSTRFSYYCRLRAFLDRPVGGSRKQAVQTPPPLPLLPFASVAKSTLVPVLLFLGAAILFLYGAMGSYCNIADYNSTCSHFKNVRGHALTRDCMISTYGWRLLTLSSTRLLPKIHGRGLVLYRPTLRGLTFLFP